MNWTILFCAIVAYVDADNTETSTIESQIDLRVVCSSTIETSCTSRHASYGVWMFYRRPIADNDIQNMAKVIYNETECLAISRFTINCSCIDRNNVTCNISDERIGQAGDTWECKIFTNAGALRSIMFSVPNEETYNKTTPVTFSKQGTLNSTMNYDRKEHENNNTTTSVKIFTTYTINHTKTSGNEDSDTAHDFTFSDRDMMIIISAVGVTLVITATVCIYAYWKRKHPRKPDTLRVEQVAQEEGYASIEGTECQYAVVNKPKKLSTPQANRAPPVENKQIEMLSQPKRTPGAGELIYAELDIEALSAKPSNTKPAGTLERPRTPTEYVGIDFARTVALENANKQDE